LYNKGYDERRSMCPPGQWVYQHTHGRSNFYRKYEDRCSVADILADEIAIKISSVPTNRTQTPEEALQLSIWSPHNTFDMSSLSEAELDEAFCRDIESFSPAFTLRLTPQNQGNLTELDWLGNSTPDWRPPNCPQIAPAFCAMLFDSASCSSSGWSLEIADGTQKELKYFSSDWKYRNDADIVGVRKGCTFSAWTEVGFGGKRLDLTARETERWVLFEKDTTSANFEENIESFQCNCWKV